MKDSRTASRGVKIRPYEQGDLEGVVAVFRSNIPKYFGLAEEPGLHDFLEKYSADYFVVEAAGDVAGAGGIALNDFESPTVSLCWGMVREDHLGTGLGKELTQFRIDLSRKKYGRFPITISTSQHTQGFYEKFGFRLTEHTPDGFGPGLDECKMRLEFPPESSNERVGGD